MYFSCDVYDIVFGGGDRSINLGNMKNEVLHTQVATCFKQFSQELCKDSGLI